jgi:3-oxoadipate enol-lactonase
MLLSHDDVGSGPAVVLLHSGVCDRRMWAPLVGPLSRRYRVINPDLRGFGESALPPERYSNADDVAQLLDHLGIAEAEVVGSSLGGRVALELATTHPDRVSALVLLCPALRDLPPSETATRFGDEEEALLDGGDVESAVELNVATWLGPEAPESTRELVRTMQRHAFEVQLAADAGSVAPEAERVAVDPAKIAVPTLVVSGDLDMDHFRGIAEHLSRVIEGAELLRLPWAAHLPSLERPDAITALLLDTLRNEPTVHSP